MRGFAIIALATFAVLPASAHEARPLSAAVEEQADGAVMLRWRAPPSVDPTNAPQVALGGACAAISDAGAGALAGQAIYRCEPGLSGAILSVGYPLYNPSISTLARVSRLSGETSTRVLEPGVGEWRIPAPESFAGVASAYFSLGVAHILFGVDHLLFLGGLLILAGSLKRILITATGFTLAHSITLALVALDMLRVSTPAVETVIALSIVFVAAEIARGRKETLAWRRPAAIAALFGLAHGAGFASALAEIGLPQTEKPAALLFFNLGVEAGQVLAILCALAAMRLLAGARALARRAGPYPRAAPRAFAYGLGAVSAWWFFDRAAALFA
jgi:hydrogenase/urease accessory protein HupE